LFVHWLVDTGFADTAFVHTDFGRKEFGRTGLEHETQGGSLMAIESHLAELEKKHHALELEINEALTHPSTDDLKLVELKRRKLHVKDEIERIRQDVSIH
jgi:hypothetical protein